jgi:YegS/Rv2252/BmrU family lipid kinase
MSKRFIQIIANPGAGQDGLNLKTVQTIFADYPVEWDIRITKQAGDAERMAREAAEAGVDVVAIFGGDGSVAEAAAALAGAQTTCLAILPGGTANVMSVELGIPAKLEDALRVAADPQSKVRNVDLGTVNDRTFVLRVSLGLEAEMVAGADREAKDKYGVFAYLLAAAQNIAAPQVARYTLVIDGETTAVDGLTCIVANSGNIGLSGVNLIADTAVDDGLLDVIVIEQAGVKTFLDLVGSVLGVNQVDSGSDSASNRQTQPELGSAIRRWQTQAVEITCDPPQSIQSDGELLEGNHIVCRIQPDALRVLVPTG